jgi:oligoribonuclease NrnB/cAMP/cGMP phosphodiesterase (DHH superfamily)
MKKASKRIKHISHNDIDGYSCTLLTEFIVEAYPEGMFGLETQNIVPNQLHGIIKKTLNEIMNYDLVIITDLAIRQDIVDIIESSGYKDKFVVIDHHQTNVNTDNYPWINIQVYQKNIEDKSNTKYLTCATRLYYQFLLNDPIFDINLLHLPSTDAIEFFIECVTAYDTKTYNENLNHIEYIKEISPRLNSLFHIIDREEFKSYIKDYISNDDYGDIKKPIGVVDDSEADEKSIREIYLLEKGDLPNYLYLTKSVEKYPWLNKLIETEMKRNQRYIENVMKRMNIINLNKNIFKNGEMVILDNYLIGLIFAEKLGSDIAEAACKANDNIDFCAVVNNNQVTFYTLKDNVNVGEIATLLGGGGHRKAAGFSIGINDANWFNKNHFFAIFNSAANIGVPTI